MGSTKNGKTSKRSTPNRHDSKNKKAGMTNKMWNTMMKCKYRKQPRKIPKNNMTNKRMRTTK